MTYLSAVKLHGKENLREAMVGVFRHEFDRVYAANIKTLAIKVVAPTEGYMMVESEIEKYGEIGDDDGGK